MILAAGTGTRLEDKTESLPKTLIPLNGQPILSYILRGWKHYSPPLDFVVIGGFCIDKLKNYLNEAAPNARVIENPEYKKGNLKTALCARSHISGSVCFVNADHVYPKKILDKLMQDPLEQITAVCDFDRPLTNDDMKMALRPDGSLKEMYKTLTSWNGGYIGMTLIPASQLSTYWTMADQVLEKQGEMINVEMVLNELVKAGETVKILDASGSLWIEVDTAEDLKNAEQKIDQIKI